MSGTSSEDTPARRLLDMLGPVERFRDPSEFGDFGLPARRTMEAILEPDAAGGPDSRLGPLEKIHVFWFAGLSCDGCTVAVTGAQSPSIESLVMGANPGLPRLIVHHPVLSLESGPAYLRSHEAALKGELDSPYVVVLEGSLGDETGPAAVGGYWAGQGEQPWGAEGADRTVTAEEWVARLAPDAAATIAIGTCATWGGVPAGYGNPTDAMGLMDFLGPDYRSTAGLPVINVPGCAPIGDNFTETVATILYFLQGFGPLPEFDDLGRPAWLYGETVHQQCNRAVSYAEGDHATDFGDANCLVSVGCWGPAVLCNMSSRGAINNAGGCMKVGGACIGCTMPGFPDKFTPFYRQAPAAATATGSRLLAGVKAPLARFTEAHLDRETRWDREGTVPTGWVQVQFDPKRKRERGHRAYDRLRRRTDGAMNPGAAWGREADGDGAATTTAASPSRARD